MDSSFFVKYIVNSVSEIGNMVINDETNSTHHEIEFLFEVNKLLDIYNIKKKEEDSVIIDYTNENECEIFNFNDDDGSIIDIDTFDINDYPLLNSDAFEKKEIVIANDYNKNVERLMKCTIAFKNDKIKAVL